MTMLRAFGDLALLFMAALTIWTILLWLTP
jgi:hypothetical protein